MKKKIQTRSLIFYLFLTAFLLFNNLPSYSQEDVNIRRREFKTEDEGFRDAWKAVRKGNNYFEQGGIYFRKALNKYLKANKYNAYNPQLNYKIGVCHYFIGQYKEAYEAFKKAYEYDKNITSDIFFMMARALHQNGQYDEAIEYYKKFESTLTPEELKKNSEVIEKYIERSRNAKTQENNPVNAHIFSLDNKINSEYDDYYPVISEDANTLYFSSRRPASEKARINTYDNRYYENIYYTPKAGDEWQNARNIGDPINSHRNEVVVGVGENNKKLYIYKGKKGDGDIYVSEYKKGKWRRPKNFSRRINSNEKESAIYITPDENELFFVSLIDKNSFGGKDIYYCKRKNKRRWSKPQNIGSTVNTVYDEEGVFFDTQSQTLYFSSKGHNSMGGYDIFKSTRNENGQWSTPENLGYPANSPNDDVFFALNPKKDYIGYFSSARKDGLGNMDLYKVRFLGKEKPMISNTDDFVIATSEEALKKNFFEETIEKHARNVTIVKGQIKDAQDSSAIKATIDIIDRETNDEITSVTSNAESGEYLVSLPAGSNYGFVVTAKGYLYHSEYFDIPASAKYQEIERNIFLNNLKVGAKMILKNIYFESGKATLQSESYTELNQVAKVLKQNPSLKIEISGHTDNVGGYTANMNLSRDRARSVVNYLVGQGVEDSRLEYKGYGFTQPIASNDTPEGRQKNRRVEFKIISN